MPCAQRIAFRPSRNCLHDTLLELILILTLKQMLLFVQVDQPASSVVKLNDANEIVVGLKTARLVSDPAVIGIYYFKEVGDAKQELQMF
jgi:glucose-1-phosphate thymidylyltransferase